MVIPTAVLLPVVGGREAVARSLFQWAGKKRKGPELRRQSRLKPFPRMRKGLMTSWRWMVVTGSLRMCSQCVLFSGICDLVPDLTL